MKTYLVNSIDRFKKISVSLDIQSILCKQSWIIFNDRNDKEVYIFEPNGSLMISINGQVSDAQWRYIAANSSIRISIGDRSYLFNPFFWDDDILTLQLDGTNNFTFMINELSFKNQIALKTLEDFEAHMEESLRLQNSSQLRENINSGNVSQLQNGTRNRTSENTDIGSQFTPTESKKISENITILLIFFGCIIIFVIFVLASS